jgi:hypothetical protein
MALGSVESVPEISIVRDVLDVRGWLLLPLLEDQKEALCLIAVAWLHSHVEG